ncbi:RND superfamily putative drug exporter [Nocardioides cavernae]|uniref:RND superfamily putative drug exporter n=1 Tax=Nocardioides cavernae TaxID=1921566 RepID=A0A7Y9KQX9_9ACTN|nr:MMPL family transporter [Nocardioides cavernae]NYE38126.1 RND superfamily putative drug exporter [Nocardioides cavernae]
MDSILYRCGRWSARHPWRVVVMWLVAVATAFGAAAAFGGEPVDDYELPSAPSQRGFDQLAAHVPAMAGASATVTVHDPVRSVDPAALERLAGTLVGVPRVASVAPPRLSEDGDTALLAIGYDVPVTHDDVMGNVQALEDAVAAAGLGDVVVAYGGEVPESAIEVGGTGEVLGVAAALVLLVLTFGSLLAAGLPLLVAFLGLGLGSAAGVVLTRFMDVSSFAPTVATMVGLGVGIDYALLLVTRFVENREAGHDPVESAARANATAGRAVVFAGVTVLVSLFGLRLGGLPLFESFGVVTALAVLAVLLAAITLVPALAAAGHRHLGGRRRRAAAGRGPTHVERWVARVVRRPVAWALLATTVLLALAAPAVGMRIWPLDPSVDPADSTARQAYDLVAAEFGPGATGPYILVADRAEVGDEEVAALHASVADHPDVAAVSPVRQSPDGALATWTAEASFAPQDPRTPELIAQLRAANPDGVEVTGYAPMQADLSEIVSERVWVVAGVVIALSVLMLMLMFRSVVVPLKAAVMNLLSIGAAYGVIVALFQNDAGARLLGLDHGVAISSFAPIIMFAILFGLSMDYEVFLLSRVREDWLATGDARRSVVTGLAATGRVISSAAAIMVAVFVGFAFDSNVLIKTLGIGMAVAIALDATVVRLVLVPASMTLLGRWAWYVPRWLDRLLPHVRVEATGHASHTEPAAVPEREPARS